MYKAAGIILTFGKLILLGRRSSFAASFQGYWSMPCGLIETSEDPKVGAIREVYEETLIDLNEKDVKFLTSYNMDEENKFAVFHASLNDLTFPNEKAQDFFEHDEWGFFNIEENSLPTPMTDNTINSILKLK
jgi:8-oxo-dGTP pyrophosphatase MutT (NUDIX family)